MNTKVPHDIIEIEGSIWFAAVVSASWLLGISTMRAQPVVSNVQASQQAGTGLVDIYYDVSSPSNQLTVSLVISTNGGVAFNAPAASLTGDLGSGVVPATGKHVVWNAGTDLAALYFPNVKVRVTADDGSRPPAPAGMALIPAGSFQMGDNLDGESDAPVMMCMFRGFTWTSMTLRRRCGSRFTTGRSNHGYNFDYAGFVGTQGPNYPVADVDWYDCVKWCNARSEMEGRTPAYYTSTARRWYIGPGTWT